MPDPLWINADSGAPAYTANELRQAMALGVMWAGRHVGGRQGKRPGGNALDVSLAGSTITVQPGLAYVDPGLSAPQGGYWVALPVAENPTGGPLAAADATNPRKDIVILRVYDHDEDASGLRTARSEYIAGTPNASPVEPAVPSGSFRLATIDVPQSGGGSPVVSNNNPYTVAPGGILPVRSQTDRGTLTQYPGLPIWRIDRNWIEVSNGTTWRVQGVGLVTSLSDLASAVTTPYAGQQVWNSGTSELLIYNGTAWAPRQRTVMATTAQTNNNNTTLSSDAVLTFAVEASSQYRFDMLVIYKAGAVADFKFGFAIPASSTLDWSAAKLSPTDATEIVSAVALTLSDQTNNAGGGGAATARTMQIRGSIRTAGSAGSVTFRFAQASQVNENLSRDPGSWLSWEKIQ
jgi:hypothetical protein